MNQPAPTSPTLADFNQYIPNRQNASYVFPNTYGASVIPDGYGDERELAILKKDPNSNRWPICYDTPIADDVIPHLRDDQDLADILAQIRALPNPTKGHQS